MNEEDLIEVPQELSEDDFTSKDVARPPYLLMGVVAALMIGGYFFLWPHLQDLFYQIILFFEK